MDEEAKEDSWDPGLGNVWNSFVAIGNTRERESLQAREELWSWLR